MRLIATFGVGIYLDTNTKKPPNSVRERVTTTTRPEGFFARFIGLNRCPGPEDFCEVSVAEAINTPSYHMAQ